MEYLQGGDGTVRRAATVARGDGLVRVKMNTSDSTGDDDEHTQNDADSPNYPTASAHQRSTYRQEDVYCE